ncbi:hypothetical protein DYB32_001638 [Aphanomyces invadans]|uniref:2'-5' RNA ligase n=1 Tax=Aphanomyces invadans TaxID=157072 RepID=A0A418B5N2_9STRA|nr:hypothetical protein DYB32_001638 [Aphanomyces invadans]
MARHALPPHLAHKSALALVLTEDDSPLTYACVQGIRHHHDKSFDRWPPHINLVYPFLANPSTQIDAILARVAAAVEATFPAVHHFVHSKKSATIFLDPDNESTRPQLQAIQAAVQAAFPECNHDTRPFVPHLTLGQTGGSNQAIASLTRLIDSSFRAKSSEGQAATDAEPTSWTLRWSIGRLVVLERQGADDPFKIVGQVALQGNAKD